MPGLPGTDGLPGTKGNGGSEGPLGPMGATGERGQLGFPGTVHCLYNNYCIFKLYAQKYKCGEQSLIIGEGMMVCILTGGGLAVITDSIMLHILNQAGFSKMYSYV